MSEKGFYRILLLSMVFHLVFLTLISIPAKRAGRTINPHLPSYSVHLVEDIIGKSMGPNTGSTHQVPDIRPQTPKKSESKKAKPLKQITPSRLPAVRSLTPKKLPAKEAPLTTKDELKRLDERISEMRRRTAEGKLHANPHREMVNRGDAGLGGARSGGGQGEQNSALIRYLIQMRDRVENSWHIPFISGARKNLEARVTVRIRRDGRIVDINMEKRSGNRSYDESVLRALRAIDPLPPLPGSIDEDPLEVEMTLRPEGVS